MAWLGLRVWTWWLASVFIFAVSGSDLVARAVATRRWYREGFPD